MSAACWRVVAYALLMIGVMLPGAGTATAAGVLPDIYTDGYVISFTPNGVPYTRRVTGGAVPSAFAPLPGPSPSTVVISGEGVVGALGDEPRSLGPAELQPPAVLPDPRPRAVPPAPQPQPQVQPEAMPLDESQFEETLGAPPPAGVETAPAPPEPAPTEEELADGIYLVSQNYVASWWNNSYRIVTGPLRFDQDDWINVAIVVGTTGALLLADEVLADFWQDDIRNSVTDDAASGFEEIGEFEHLAYAALGSYAISELLGAKREKAAALMAFESLVLTGLLTNGLKWAGGRERPANTDNRFEWEGPSGDGFSASFPSGHASQAFSVASVIAEVYDDEYPWVPFVIYPAAAGVGLARVNDDRHWFSDIFVGGALGYFIGRMVVEYNPFLRDNNLMILPFSDSGGQGVNFSYAF